MVSEKSFENKISPAAAAYREYGSAFMVGCFKSYRNDRIPAWQKKLTWYNEETERHEPVWERFKLQTPKLAAMAGQKGITLRTHRSGGRCKSKLSHYGL